MPNEEQLFKDQKYFTDSMCSVRDSETPQQIKALDPHGRRKVTTTHRLCDLPTQAVAHVPMPVHNTIK